MRCTASPCLLFTTTADFGLDFTSESDDNSSAPSESAVYSVSKLGTPEGTWCLAINSFNLLEVMPLRMPSVSQLRLLSFPETKVKGRHLRVSKQNFLAAVGRYWKESLGHLR